MNPDIQDRDFTRGLVASGEDKGEIISCAYCSRSWSVLNVDWKSLAEHRRVKHPRRRRSS